MKLIVLILLCALPALADSILFVGNSLTGVNNMPGLFKELAKTQGRTPDVFVSSKFGQTLGIPLADPDLKKLARSKKWDSVVLQEYSDFPLRKPREFEQHVIDFKQLVPGAKIYLFENWPYKAANAGVMPQLDVVYDSVAKKAGATVVHLGRAVDDLRLHTKLKLYVDEKHPTPIVTYMNALMMLDAIYGLSPNVFAGRGSKTNSAEWYVGAVSEPPLFDLPADEVTQAKAAAIKFK